MIFGENEGKSLLVTASENQLHFAFNLCNAMKFLEKKGVSNNDVFINYGYFKIRNFSLEQNNAKLILYHYDFQYCDEEILIFLRRSYDLSFLLLNLECFTGAKREGAFAMYYSGGHTILI